MHSISARVYILTPVLPIDLLSSWSFFLLFIEVKVAERIDTRLSVAMPLSRSTKSFLRKLEVSHDENLTYTELFLSVGVFITNIAHLIGAYMILILE